MSALKGHGLGRKRQRRGELGGPPVPDKANADAGSLLRDAAAKLRVLLEDETLMPECPLQIWDGMEDTLEAKRTIPGAEAGSGTTETTTAAG